MKNWLVRQPDRVISAIAGAAAFGCYFSMYAFRKPFTAATFEGLAVLGFGLKSWLVIAQVLGYATAKFVGIKLISELGKQQRGVAIIGLILWAEFALLGFGLAGPLWLKIGFLFLTGFRSASSGASFSATSKGDGRRICWAFCWHRALFLLPAW